MANKKNEVERLMLRGLSNADIALALNIKEVTVKTYLSQLYDEAEVMTRFQYIAKKYRTSEPAPVETPINKGTLPIGQGNSNKGEV